MAVRLFIKTAQFVRIDDLSEMLYVSRSTITNDIRNVEDSLKSYHITLIRRPNYGLHIQGSEFDIRNCMISQFKDNKWAQRFSDKEENELKEISKILLNNIQNQKVVLSKSMIQEMT